MFIMMFRSFATPPEAVIAVCECVAIIRGLKDTSWKAAKGMMTDPNFLLRLKEMKCENVTQKQQQSVKAVMKVGQ